jgi:hypothetical protein
MQFTLQDGRVVHSDEPILFAMEKRNAGYVVNVYDYGVFHHTAVSETTLGTATVLACELGRAVAIVLNLPKGSFLRCVDLLTDTAEQKNAVNGLWSI